MNSDLPPAAGSRARDVALAPEPNPAHTMESDGAFSHEEAAAAALCELRLAQHLAGLAVVVELVAQTGSTNSDLLERARSAAPAQPILRAAQRQTNGRGRRGRSWQGAGAGSLLFSVALPWHRDVADSSAVTLACGLAVAALVEDELALDRGRVQVKWPNDILLDGGKLCGILVEMAEDAAGARTLVIGLGMNLVADAALRDSVAGAATAPLAGPAGAAPVADLAAVLGAPAVRAQREAWLGRLTRTVLAAARQFERAGFAGGPAAFAARCAYLDEAVDVHGAGSPTLQGLVRGVDAHGRLLLATAQGMHAVSSGEVSVRPRSPRAQPPAGGAP